MWHKKETVQPLTGYTVPYIEITSLWGVPKRSSLLSYSKPINQYTNPYTVAAVIP